MISKNHKSALLIMTDRATDHTRLHKLTNQHSPVVSNAIIKRVREVNYPIQTITFDNKKGFTNHITVANTFNVTTYFTRL